MQRAVLNSICLLALMALAGCSSGWKKVHSKNAPEEVATNQVSSADMERRAEALARFATGVSLDLNGDPEAALEQYYKSSLADPRNEGLAVDVARALIAKRQPDRAVRVLNRVVENKSGSGVAHGMLARAYLSQGKTNLALQASETALQKKPDLLLGYQTAAEIHLGRRNFPAALQLLDRAAGQPGVDPPYLNAVAEMYQVYGRLSGVSNQVLKAKVLPVLDRFERLNPRHPHWLQQLADRYGEIGETERAAQFYNRVLTDYPEVALLRDSIREKLANLYLKSDDPTLAAEQLQAIIRDNPTRYPQAYYFLGSIANQQKKYEEAAEHFQRSISIAPDFEPAWFDLAAMQINLNKTAAALETLEKARQRFPRSFTVELFSGLTQSRLKNYSEAVKHFVTAEVIAGASEPARLTHTFYFQIGAASERNGDFDQAERYFLKAINLEPDFHEALNYLGYMWVEKEKNLEQAREMIAKAVELDPKSGAYLDSLGWAYFKLNQPKPALDALLKAVDLMEEPDATVFDHLGDVYRALNDPEKAREFWTKALEIEPTDAIRKKLQP